MNFNQNRYPFQNYFYPNVPPMCYCMNMFYQGNWDMEEPEEFRRYPRNRYNYDDVESVTDHGKEPYVVNIHETTMRNRAFRKTLWTGDHLQLTLMSIDAGEDIGLEVHPDVDQFVRIESGQGFVQMGNRRNNLTFEKYVQNDDVILIPAGTWHNLTNTGNRPLKLYTIYAPPEHPYGTIHRTKAEALEAEENDRNYRR